MIGRERVAHVHHELDDIISDYYRNGNCTDTVSPPLIIDWKKYVDIDELGQLALFVYKYDVGYSISGFAMYILGNHPHYKNSAMAMCDTLAVYRDKRGNGIGRKLVEHAIDELKKIGITHVTHNYRTVYDAAPLFPKLGFELIEHTYMKRIGD